MNFHTYNVRLVFTEPILGTVPKNKEIYSDFVAARALELIAQNKLATSPAEVGPTVTVAEIESEADTVQEVEERGWTGFHELDGRPFLFDYAVKGHLKETGNILKDQLKVLALKSKIEDNLFVQPRRIFFEPAGDGELIRDVLERPLRAQTARGPRVSLVRSDTLDDVAIRFRLVLLDHKEIKREHVESLFEYGMLRGMGQWRNGGWGRYVLDRFEEAE